jgi:AraC-like DNA-binding protein
MPADVSDFTETTINGPRTRSWVLECGECSEFNAHRIARLGTAEAVAPYRRVRLAPTGSFLLATAEGEGRILLDGKWQRVTAGSLFMAPPRVLNAFYAAPGRRWCFSWVRYHEPHYVRPMVGAASPVRAAAGGTELVRAIAGLRVEWESARDARLIHHWVSLIQALAERAAKPSSTGDDRLPPLWAAVEATLDHPWTLEKLAAAVHTSSEALRKRCLRELGRSPMQHVTYIRMQRARHLLESTQEKLDVIAQNLGFTDGMSFSRAFKRWIGHTPSEYRQRH